MDLLQGVLVHVPEKISPVFQPAASTSASTGRLANAAVQQIKTTDAGIKLKFV